MESKEQNFQGEMVVVPARIIIQGYPPVVDRRVEPLKKKNTGLGSKVIYPKSKGR